MNERKNRKYVSPARERQAAATRRRILDAAEALLQSKGFAGMTISEIAKTAKVSPQTIYAVFTSKAGIISAAIEDHALQDVRNVDAINRLLTSDDPVIILGSLAKVIRNIHEGDGPALRAVHSACLVSPQLAELEKELGEIRRERQQVIATSLAATGQLLPHLDEEATRDIVWALTSRDMFHLLVVRRGWTPENYEKQLFSMLMSALIQPDASPKHFR